MFSRASDYPEIERMSAELGDNTSHTTQINELPNHLKKKCNNIVIGKKIKFLALLNILSRVLVYQLVT